MLTQAITLILFFTGFAAVAYAMFTFQWACRYLAKHYPAYYKRAGRPQILNGFSIFSYMRGSNLMMRLARGNTPAGFPQDKVIRRKVGNIQTAIILLYVAWFGMVFMLFRSMFSN